MEIMTPEGLALEMTLAGIGSRAVAAILDALIIIGATIGFGFVVSISGLAESLPAAIIAFALWNLLVLAYFPLFETLNSGQTPGKRRAGIQVVRADGGPVSFLPVLIRNLVRIIDFLPMLYGVGLVVMFASKNNQRLGDLAAGTVVVKRAGGQDPMLAPRLPPATSVPVTGWDVTAVSKEEVGVIRRFLDRRATLQQGPRAALAAQLYEQVSPKVTRPPDAPQGERFLEIVAAIKTGHA